ncbi:MAG: hypothetical protein HZB85_03975 [Deltaproteobacteria bacterium]|nr:hypothetical protein [Deltaproteobacteria bacterium]
MTTGSDLSIVIHPVPDRPERFDENPSVREPEADLAERLQSAYRACFAEYEKELKKARNGTRTPFAPVELSDYRKISVVFNDGEDEDEVVFDFSLYEYLLEIYVFEGWNGILRIEEALDKLVPQPAGLDAPSGGVPANPGTHWVAVQTFFRFTRDLLALLIREALVEIERKAATAITANLSRSANLISTAWTAEFRIERERKEKEELVPFSEGKTVKVVSYSYRFKNRELSDSLFETLSEAVRQKFAYEDALKSLSDVRDALLRAKQTPRYHEYQDEEIAGLTGSELELQQLAYRSEEFLRSIREVIGIKCPLGLIALDGLRIGFTREKMEQKIGEALWELYGRLDEMGRGIDPEHSRVAAMLPAAPIGKPVAWDAVKRRVGIEKYVVDAVIDGAPDDPGRLSLAHEETLHRLVEKGVIARDSFESVVYAQYLCALIDGIEAKREDEKASEKFWGNLGRMSAALSLASLATPPTAEFAPVLMGVATIADLAVLAYSVHSIIGNLAQLDHALRLELTGADAFALEHLARIGELFQIRSEMLDNIEQQALMELVLTAGGARWASLKKLTLMRGYYFDMETLLDDGEKEN